MTASSPSRLREGLGVGQGECEKQAHPATGKRPPNVLTAAAGAPVLPREPPSRRGDVLKVVTWGGDPIPTGSAVKIKFYLDA